MTSNFQNFGLKTKKVLPLYIYFLISVLALSYTENIDIGLKKIETQLSFIVLPFAVSISNINIKNLRHNIITSFIQGCILAIIIGFINSFFLFLNTNNIDSFFYNNMAAYTHNSHFAMYLNLALIFVYSLIIKSNKINYLNLLIAALFNLTIVALISKTGIITLVLTNLIFSFYLIKKKSILFSVLTFSLFISFIAITYNNSSVINKRINEFTNVILSPKLIKQESSTNSRIKALKVSTELIKESPWIGYGIGDVQSELNKSYLKQNYIDLKKRNLNTHNMYVQRFLSTGIIGFLSLSLLLIVPLITLKKKSKLFIYFTLLMIINLGTEAMLIKREGIIFFVFFIIFFTFDNRKTSYFSIFKGF